MSTVLLPSPLRPALTNASQAAEYSLDSGSSATAEDACCRYLASCALPDLRLGFLAAAVSVLGAALRFFELPAVAAGAAAGLDLRFFSGTVSGIASVGLELPAVAAGAAAALDLRLFSSFCRKPSAPNRFTSSPVRAVLSVASVDDRWWHACLRRGDSM